MLLLPSQLDIIHGGGFIAPGFCVYLHSCSERGFFLYKTRLKITILLVFFIWVGMKLTMVLRVKCCLVEIAQVYGAFLIL